MQSPKPIIPQILTWSWKKITPESTIGIWCTVDNTCTATAEVRWTILNSAKLNAITPAAIPTTYIATSGRRYLSL
eukprot:CAMPEP_0169197310 /NCGR_PEP_ID=MMETSP1016-20121227/8199_1 /TAXON_ID=342587 /ORGANISM="Karlodinium micrum, Strain CCMP2283" /LENGTH=74 /DNA_ID=CAMNT_0009273947 /DNA_START=220 /DNA_END=444 /DNA_ORIENTATION=-